MKIDRLLSMTLYLINRKKVTARELADHFEVSLRTVQRDIESLSLAGVPVYADRGKDGGYRIMDTYTIDKHYFNPGELAALTSLVTRLNSLLGHSPLKKAEEKLLNLSKIRADTKKHDTLIMDFTPWGMDETLMNRFRTVYKAVENRQVLDIRYATPSGNLTDRQVEPLSVIIKGAAWYVYGFCRLRKAPRLFKISRMTAVETLPEFFDPDRHPPYHDDFNQSGDDRRKTLFVLRFAASARGRITDYYHPDSLHFMPDGTIMGFFPFPEDEWVYSWILSFGPLVEVLEPPHARARINEWIRHLKDVYKNPPGTN